VGFYWLMHRYNWWNINTSTLVNVRGADTFTDKKTLARASAGVVEGKLLEKQVEHAAEAVARVARASQDPAIKRASQGIDLVRNSVRVARTSLGASGARDPETGAATTSAAGLARMQQTVSQIEKALAAAPAAEREIIQIHLDAVRATAERLAAIDRQLRKEPAAQE
jgi:hypothetical protein